LNFSNTVSNHLLGTMKTQASFATHACLNV